MKISKTDILFTQKEFNFFQKCVFESRLKEKELDGLFTYTAYANSVKNIEEERKPKKPTTKKKSLAAAKKKTK